MFIYRNIFEWVFRFRKISVFYFPGKERFGDYHHLPISRRFCRKQAAFHINTPYCGTQVFQGKNSTGRTKGVKKV